MSDQVASDVSWNVTLMRLKQFGYIKETVWKGWYIGTVTGKMDASLLS